MPLTEGDLRQISELWRLAEERVKRSELVNKTIAIPALNELRYAGYHIIDALHASEKSIEIENLQKAVRHCQRAIYDAVDAEVLYYLEGIQLFQTDYRDIPIEVQGFDYQTVRRQWRESNNLIELVKRDKESRSDHYRTIMDHCDALRTSLGHVEDAREALNKLVRAKKEADSSAEGAKNAAEAAKKSDAAVAARRWKITTAIAAVVAIAAVGRLVFDKLYPASSATPAHVISHP